jgi:predicted DsbA family dithiol-disulfide isomerase
MPGMSQATTEPDIDPSATRLQVEIWSDLVCPWCYLGRARFGQALAAFPNRDAVDVTHRSFELDPSTPRGRTTTNAEMLATKFGDRADAVRAGEERLAGMTGELGLAYRIDRLNGNTLDAHRLVKLGAERGLADDLVTRLYHANFAEGRSIFDVASLTEIGVGAGLDPVEARAILEGSTYTDQVREDEQLAAEIGITGVPFYVLDRAYGISGAQAADVFSSVLEEVWQERHTTPDMAT